MKYKRSKSKCQDCPLRDRARVWGEGWESPKLAIIGEAPGKNEDNEGRPFVGSSGRFFTWALSQAGTMRSKIWITNVLSCRPPGNDINSPEAGEAFQACTWGFWEEIKDLKSRGVTTIIPMGKTALSMFGIEGALHQIRGSVYQAKGFHIIPTFHPAYLVRMGYTQKGAPVDFTATWIADLAKGIDIAENGWEPPKEKFILNPKWEDLESFEESSKGKELALDIEVIGGENPKYNQIVMIGFAYDEEHAIVVPLVDGNQTPYWPNGKFQKMKTWVNRMLQTHKLLLQNALYDILILRQHGFEVDMSHVGDDTMLMHHAISPEAPHDLGYITSLYGKTPYHKGTLKNTPGNILDLPQQEARTYNARDCVVLHQIIGGLRKDIEETGTRHVYETQSLQLLAPLLEAKETGILLDTKRLESYRKHLNKTLKDLDKKLRSIGNLPSSFNLDSDDELRWILYSQRPGKFDKLRNLDDYEEHLQVRYKCNDCGSTRWYWNEGFNNKCGKCGGENLTPKDQRSKPKKAPGTKSHNELLAIKEISEVKPFTLPPKFDARSTNTGKGAVNDQARTSLLRAISNRLADIDKMKNPKEEERESLQTLRDFIEVYNQFAATGKLLSTYTHYPTWPDGRVHGSMLIHGTATGRLAHRNPNLANTPKAAGKEAREPFIASPGYILLSRDYTNLEVFILAYITEDEPLIEYLESGGNLHDKNTRDLFGFTPDDPQWKPARDCAKVFQFGGIQYAGGDKEIHERMMLKAPQLNLTFSDYKKAKQAYMRAHPSYVTWKDNSIAKAHRDRVAETALGRKRILGGKSKDIEKEALNTPIQGSAADIINLALIRAWDKKNLQNWDARFLLQIHDELIWEVREDQLDGFDSMLKSEMEKPVPINGKDREFKSTREVGYNLGKLEEQEE